MNDYSSWTDEQINEAVFKANIFADKSHCYTHDWSLFGKLLEEMQPFVILTKNEFGWQCSSKFCSVSHKETAGRAICEAWLARKEEK